MHFSRYVIAAALVGFGAAKTHDVGGGEKNATTATGLNAAISETKGTETRTAKVESTAAAQAAAATGAAAGAAGEVKTHVVQVGSGELLTFSPNNVIAAAGDLVQFQFYPKNHSVVQSTFDQPCVPIQNVMANKTDAFFSGFMPTAANATKQLTYTIRVTDTKPVWFYCSQAKHCQSGMVGAINAVTTGNKTVDAFKGLAAAAVDNLSPGQAPGSGAAAAPAASSSGTAAAAAAGGDQAAPTGADGAAASTSSASTPAQQTANAAPGRLADVGRQSIFGLGLSGLAAFLML